MKAHAQCVSDDIDCSKDGRNCDVLQIGEPGATQLQRQRYPSLHRGQRCRQLLQKPVQTPKTTMRRKVVMLFTIPVASRREIFKRLIQYQRRWGLTNVHIPDAEHERVARQTVQTIENQWDVTMKRFPI
jgi:hypothetical protein